MGDAEQAVVQVETDISAVDATDWDACANPSGLRGASPHPADPFTTHAFLKALEDSGCVSARSGWMPQHLVLTTTGGRVRGCAPCYLKGHSMGEYVFDHAWADAYEHAGGTYYPKLQMAVPFTPVTGRRLLVPDCPDAQARQATLASAAATLLERHGVSGLHVTFPAREEWEQLGGLGYLQRIDKQYHWRNQGYGRFEDFLDGLSSRKRKIIRKERREALDSGIVIQHLTGRDLTEAHWDAFFAFYMDTGARKWGRPYLNRRFFSLVGEAMAEHILLVLASRDGRPVAGALNFIGADALYGRYWGCVEDHPFLHFELCYYQAIDHAIAHGLGRVEAGAQGPHKIARGYLPEITYSCHLIADAGLRRAVADYLRHEQAHVRNETDDLRGMSPFRRDGEHDNGGNDGSAA